MNGDGRRFENTFPTQHEFSWGKKQAQLTTVTATDDTTVTKFYGYCYYCDYARHSQNYCPLKQCTRCFQYGHSAKVCGSSVT